jgi:glycosyltransferase involved in cell wall biosynthesis
VSLTARAEQEQLRILLVSQMYPGPTAPDLGVFVKELADELERQGHVLERAVLDARGGGALKYGRLAARALGGARRFRPDVVYAHFLVPAGAIAALSALAVGAPLVLTAHGRDVRNIGAIPGVRIATRLAAGRATAVIAVSEFLRGELVAKLPEIGDRVHVIDCGVDLGRFRGRDASPVRERLGWTGAGPFFLCVGSLEERKNPVRLADAFARVGAGSLAFVGEGPLRSRLEGRSNVRVVGRVPHERVADWIAACDVLCQPSLIEPFGQAILEALASERPVLATRIGGPPELVRPGAGVLVDPGSIASIEDGLRAVRELPTPNAAARAIAAEHDVRRQAQRVSALLASGGGS